MKKYNIEKDMRYLQLLANTFPTIANASTEIINLQAILNLPKGTEHFLADIHGEYEAFQHVLKNASGNIKRKVNELFGNTLREQEKRELLLSRAETRISQSHGRGYQRLVSHHASSTRSCLPDSFQQIHTLKSKEVSTCRLFLYHTGIAA